MAQTAPVPPAADASRPLPRRTGGPAKAVRPPRLVPLDGAWMVTLAAGSAVVSAQATQFSRDRLTLTGTCLAALTTALLYLLGWRARDRAAGVIAGLLLATSLPFALHAAAAPRDALLALLTVASLLSFVAGSSLLALALAGLAAVVRPDALLLGALLMGLALVQRRRRAALGIGLFLVFAGSGWAALTGMGYQHVSALHIGARGGLVAWAVAPGMAFITWMLLPFCAELGEGPRRARWLPVVLWAIVYFGLSCFVRLGDFAATLCPLLPLWYALAGGGLSRLFPALTGEIPLPWARYLLVTVAVLSLLAMRFTAEAPLLNPTPAAVTTPAIVTMPAIVTPPPIVAKPAPALTPPARPVIIPVPVPVVHQAAPPAITHPAPQPTPKPKPVAAKPAVIKPKPAPANPYVRYVPLYIRRNGRLVRRSQWAVAWDRAHPGAR